MSVEVVAGNASKLATALRSTKAGDSLASTYRWSLFRTDETNSDWREILGATAIDISHGELMYQIGRNFLKLEEGRYTPQQEETLLYGILVHDFGEAIIDGNGIGDVSAQIKTKEHEAIEVNIAKLVISTLPLEDELIEKLIYSYEQVVEGGDPELQQAFKALEKTEYVMTALKAFQNCRRREVEGKSGVTLEKAMVGRVIVIDLPKVLDIHTVAYPNSIGRYVRSMDDVIDEAYEYSQDWLRNNGWRNTADHVALCDQFEQKWAAFKG